MRDGCTNLLRGGCALTLAGSMAASAAAGVMDRGPAIDHADAPSLLNHTGDAAADRPAPEFRIADAAVDALAAYSQARAMAPQNALVALASNAAAGFDGLWSTEMARRAASAPARPTTWNGVDAFAAEVKYFEDFEGRSLGNEWNVSRLSAMEGMTRFAGPFRNESSTVHVAVTQDQSYMMSVDLRFVATRLGSTDASDLLRITIDGEIAFEERFERLVSERAAMRAKDPEVDASVYPNLIVPFRAGFPVAEIRIESIAAGEPGGEMWGFDNVMIDTAPKVMASAFGEESSPRSAARGGGGGASPGGAPGAGRTFGPGSVSDNPGATHDPSREMPRFPFVDSNPFVEEPQKPLDEPVTVDPDPIVPLTKEIPEKRPPSGDEPPTERELPPDVPAPGALVLAPLALALGLRRKR